MELGDFLKARTKAERDTRAAVNTVLESFKQETGKYPRNITVELMDYIGENWHLKLRVSSVHFDI
jgi:hypothetical protein